MKKLLWALSLLLCVNTLQASELSSAYKNEYTFLKAQKSELQSRFIKEQTQQKDDLGEAKDKLEALQEKLISLSDTLKVAEEKLENVRKKASDLEFPPV